MTKSDNTINEKFREYMDSLPIKKHTEAVQAIMKECLVNRNVVYDWKASRRRIAPIYQKTIQQTLNTSIFN